MKYSIYTVLNSDYMTFGKVFINSLYDKVDMNKVKHIFILDIGLTKQDKDYFKKYKNVRILSSDFDLDFGGGIHSENWIKAVVSKTYCLRKLLINESVEPVVMIDSDCMFIRDISDLIDTKYDMQICYRNNHPTPLLGSYVSFNNREKSINFLNKWIDTIPTIQTPWKESPALSQTYPLFKNKMDLDLVPVHKVSSYEYNDMDNEDVKIIHFKTGAKHTTVEETIQKRIEERGFKKYVERYLGD